jgi:L-2-hydroxyglutarate oxidase LhgO
MTESVEALVVGAGVVGLAVARALAVAGHDTLLIERHDRFGEETSSRNSGVVHSGLYYPTGSLKATLCVEGRRRLRAYCAERGVRELRCGKLVVAQVRETPALEALFRRGVANGVEGLEILTAADARAREPEVRCDAAIWSPETGIVDVHELMTALLGDFEAAGGVLATRSEAQHARITRHGLEIDIASGGATGTYRARWLVNAAGLAAAPFLARIDGYPAGALPRARYARGHYFACRQRPFRHLVYPMPGDAGLGVHATLDLDGSVRFGPDVEWIGQPDDYRVDPARAAAFYAAIREYWPALADDSLSPAYAGIRPKLVGPGEPAADFRIDDASVHGIPGLVSLLGIESPGLTASLAIAERVIRALASRARPTASTRS